MTLHTCKSGHLTTFKDCQVCKRTLAQRLRLDLAKARKENKELRRQVKNLTQAIEAGRAF